MATHKLLLLYTYTFVKYTADYKSLLDESFSKPVASLSFSFSYACKGCKHYSQQHPQVKVKQQPEPTLSIIPLLLL